MRKLRSRAAFAQYKPSHDWTRRHAYESPGTHESVAAGFGISVGTAHAYVHFVIALLVDRAPGLTAALRTS